MSSFLKSRVPQYQDEVKHKTGEVTGIVVAIYTEKHPGGKVWLDVATEGEQGPKMYYHTSADNWEVIKAADPDEQN